MTSNATNGTSTAAAAKPPTAKRFELPALNFQFGSLTEGTNIPPPLPSPILEEPATQLPQTPRAKTANGAPAGLDGAGNSVTVSSGSGKKSSDAVPVSPTGSSRGSLRRYLSKSLLNASYEEQAPANGQGPPRPPSRTASVLDDRKAKRSSGWFRRLTSSDGTNKRTSLALQDSNTPQPAATGPPPPKIPEMSQWKAQVDTSLGDDLFKSIR
ncbi:uncharacterized protein B0I36DRAFT_359024 [Microdochium trichocladiopsis]|uniref:Uncharacterized protein n=1 Tax=Microdochium trichocladiopsis TaxID=1682393 RepID=A0A9P8YEA9_9PEZI|nr:uncharacterized protein B0I36DRAFT_359024 [Microdochium trichocladiopsis]KAH7037307.1 hypothetical protein B0I36DRAFT_359024 [Microdochium trichocladiopsis]